MVPHNLAIFDLSTPDLLIILAIALLLFGGKKIPELSRSLSDSLKEFKHAVASERKDSGEPQASETDSTVTSRSSEEQES